MSAVTLDSATIFYLFGLLTAVGSLTIMVGFLWPHRHSPAVKPLIVAIAGCALWSLSWGATVAVTATGRLVSTSPTFVVFETVEYLSIYLVLIGVLLFALEFTGRERYVRPKVVGGLLIVPTIVVVLVATSPSHGLWQSAVPGADSPPNPGFFLHGPYAYTLLGLAFVLLLDFLIRSNRIYRAQGILVLIAFLLPALGDLSYITGAISPPFYPTPIAFAISTALFTVAIYRYRFAQITPVAWRTILSSMNQALVVVDQDGRISLANDQFGLIVDQRADTLLGEPIADVLPGENGVRRTILGLLERAVEQSAEIQLDDRYYSISATICRDERNRTLGRLLLFSDITAGKHREHQLAESKQELETRQEKLDLLKQVFARVLRHNLRNELSVIRGYADVITETGDAQSAAYAGEILESSDALLATGEKARTIETYIDGSIDRRPIDVAEMLDSLLEQFTEEFDGVTVEVTGDPECTVDAHEGLILALENLLENAIVHHDRDDPTVRICVTRDDREVSIEITDDGPGIPPAEIDVLTAGEENSLHHGSGAGLWLANFVVEQSDGSLEFRREEHNTTVKLVLPAAKPSPDSS